MSIGVVNAATCAAQGGYSSSPTACTFVQSNEPLLSITKVGNDAACRCGQFKFAQNVSGNTPYYSYSQQFSLDANGNWPGTFTLPMNSSSYQRVWMECSHSACPTAMTLSYDWSGWYIKSGTYSTDMINFTGYPLDGYSPLEVTFTVSNFTSVNSSGTSWSFGDGTIGTGTTAIVNHTYQNPGIYSVIMNFFNMSGYAQTVTKNNYILASTPGGMIVNLDVKSAVTGALIQDSSVGIKNTTTGVWRNTTAPTGLVYFSTTDPGYLYPLSQNQSITLAANKTGYSSASVTFNIPYTEYRARLFLMPTTIVNETGTGTVVANVIRNKDGLTISGASVVLDSGQMGTTNSAGAVTLYNVTAGQRYASVSDSGGGYQSTQYAFNLTAGETKLIVIQMVRVGETPVPTYVTPTSTIAPNSTYDPNDPNSPVYGNKTASQINIEGGAAVLGMLYQLVGLWPAIVLLIFVKFVQSAFK
jgi:hypothetical protein